MSCKKWNNVCTLVTNCSGANSRVILVYIPPVASQLGNKHQNNPPVSAETVCHSSTYIILYIWRDNATQKQNKNFKSNSIAPTIALVFSIFGAWQYSLWLIQSPLNHSIMCKLRRSVVFEFGKHCVINFIVIRQYVTLSHQRQVVHPSTRPHPSHQSRCYAWNINAEHLCWIFRV